LTDAETAHAARSAGAVAVLSKGGLVDDLISTVREAAATRSDRLELLEWLPAAAAVAH
jgi:DNA-binding NarL/FixJ family response regulator